MESGKCEKYGRQSVVTNIKEHLLLASDKLGRGYISADGCVS